MADGAAEACICILFYGAEEKHFQLAQRVLNEPMRCLAKRNIAFRFGCNAVGAETTQFLVQQIADHFHDAVLFHSPENILKYPMMRKMFHAPPVKAPITMWFDHDSYLEPTLDVNNWFDRIVLNLSHCDMNGSVYTSELSAAQRDWVTEQSWFHKERDKPYLRHALGGWWSIRTELLQQWDWPPPDLKQKNGDVVLGALCQHQNLRLCHFRDGLCINANDAGVEAAQPRTMV